VREKRRVILTEPGRRTLTQGYVRELAKDLSGDRCLTIVCGRYGGMDERVSKALATEAVSLGDFVLSGGEIVAAALSDAVIRLLGGVLGNEESLIGESFSREGALGPQQGRVKSPVRHQNRLAKRGRGRASTLGYPNIF
jgi:tRNA (guanine37-N1)-methyltransferase